MKKLIASIVTLALCMGTVFAVKLPTGESVRSDNVKMDGDAIVSVELREPTTIATPIGPVEVYGVVDFYKNGALKDVKIKDHTNVVTENGNIKAADYMSFYESGSLMKFYQSSSLEGDDLFVMVEGQKIIINGNVTCYDSGDAKKVIPYFISTPYINADGTSSSRNLKFNKAGCDFTTDTGNLYIYKNGSVLSFVANKSNCVQTSIGEMFVNNAISFWEDGSLRSVINDDTLITTINGIKMVIPPKVNITFYKSGKVHDVENYNMDIEYTVGKDSYTCIAGEGGDYFVFAEDGTLISTPYSRWNSNSLMSKCHMKIISFDGSGRPRLVYLSDDENLYVTNQLCAIYPLSDTKVNVLEFQAGYVEDNRLILTQINKNGTTYLGDYDVKTGDSIKKDLESFTNSIFMVYFDDAGKPSSFCTYSDKTDDFGRKIRDTSQKKLFKQIKY